jgi:hypothetical protein
LAVVNVYISVGGLNLGLLVDEDISAVDGPGCGDDVVSRAVQIGDAGRCLVILQAFYRAAYYTDEKAFLWRRLKYSRVLVSRSDLSIHPTHR